MALVSELQPLVETFDVAAGYLDWAAFGPLSPSVRDEVLADASLLVTGRTAGIELVATRVDEARALVASILGSDVDEVVLQPSTTHGLTHAMQGLEGEVIVSAQEFPALRLSAHRAQQSRGRLTVREIDPLDGIVTVDAVAEALTDEVTAVAVSLVDFRTGALADLPAIRELIGDRLLIVDAVQGFGVVDVDWAAADVVCSNGYKWLRAGRGTGFARFSPRARERIQPVLSGISGFDGDALTPGFPPPVDSAAAYSIAPTDPLAASRLATALRELSDAGIPAVAAELLSRAQAVMEIADRYGVPVLTPRDRHAGIVTLVPQDAPALAAALANQGVTVTARGATIRVAPHVGTRDDTLQMLADALAEVAVTTVAAVAPPAAEFDPADFDIEGLDIAGLDVAGVDTVELDGPADARGELEAPES